MGPDNTIRVRGAREHNLKNIDVDIPRDKLVVITGLSGSGKSSLAFDTIYAEGQRRYVESLSAYARQFLGQLEKPNVDHIEGLSPAISIDQKSASHNPRSTVGTVTEIYDYLRVLYANLGEPHCPQCGRKVARQSAQQIVDRLVQMPEGTRFQVIAPVVRARKGEYKGLFKDLKADGFSRVRVDGKEGTVDDPWDLAKYEKHTIEVVVDRLVMKPDIRARLQDTVEQALKAGKGVVTIWTPDGETAYSEAFACPDCGVSLPELAPRSFSFNNPFGACEKCSGLGTTLEVDPGLMVRNPDARLVDGCFHPAVVRTGSWIYRVLEQVGKEFGFKVTQRWKDLTKKQQKTVLYGSDKEFHQVYKAESEDSEFHWEGYDTWEGLIPRLERLYKETESEGVRAKIQGLMSNKPCPACGGRRLRKESLAVTIRGRHVQEVCELPVERLLPWFDEYAASLDAREGAVAGEVIKEIRARLTFMQDVGLEYLTLGRSATTLSGGEAQRIRLATQIGSGLVGVLYVLDEPSIGLHPRDESRLIGSLKGLRDLGNTLLVVEHDRDMMEAADWLIDLGPGAGEHGGRVVAAGTPAAVRRSKGSWTGRFLAGTFRIPVPAARRKGNGQRLVVKGAQQNNLKKADVAFPLGTLTCVTGVSGSGKSTLVHEVLYKALARALLGASEPPGAHAGLDGLQHVDKVVLIDQSPIGRTPRSNPATYTGVFTPIRELFAATKEARTRGYAPGRFSFNVRGGRCEACEGDGFKQIEMHFMADVFVPCEVCKGARYNTETLAVKYKGKSIRDVLDFTVEDALVFFEHVPRIARTLQTIQDVGLGYVKLGQPAPTLSGGEAQRVKLATELTKRATGKTVYILDEPTTGLHAADIQHLLGVLHRLVDAGNTVIVIEHNLDVIKVADWLVDLGPEGGDRGGELVAEGTPEDVARRGTYTGKYLAGVLEDARAAPAPRAAPRPRRA